MKRFETLAGWTAVASKINDYEAILLHNHKQGTLKTLSAERAVAEAERVLAEAEAETLAVHVRIGGSAVRCPHSAAVPVGLNVVLAESLADILPVLDRLAGLNDIAWEEREATWAMTWRNRATLAGMEA